MGTQHEGHGFDMEPEAGKYGEISEVQDPKLQAKIERIYAAIEDPTRSVAHDDVTVDFDVQIDSGADSPWDLHFFRMLGLFLFFLFALVTVAVRNESTGTVVIPVVLSATGFLTAIYAHRRIVVRRRLASAESQDSPKAAS